MEGREDRKENDLFFVCSLIEYIARRTKNHRRVIVNALGEQKLQHLYELADIFHSENIDKLADELIENYNISTGQFDNIKSARYSIPTHWDIGKVYQRLILAVSKYQHKKPIGTLIEIYNSWLADKIDDYNSSMYYENPDYHFQSYLHGDVL